MGQLHHLKEAKETYEHRYKIGPEEPDSAIGT